jgi:hypothetical protein
MELIKVNTTFIANGHKTTFSVQGKKDKNRLLFDEDNIKINVVINDNDFSLIRQSDAFLLKYDFNEENPSGVYDIKDLGKLDLDIDLKKLEIKDNLLVVEYNLNDTSFEYLLEYEVIE